MNLKDKHNINCKGKNEEEKELDTIPVLPLNFSIVTK
jgi:hypothetical protein